MATDRNLLQYTPRNYQAYLNPYMDRYGQRTRIREQALCESEQRSLAILEDIEEGYFETDLAGNLVFVNEPICRISGYSKDTLLGMNNREYTDSETAKRMYELFSGIYRTGSPVKVKDFQISMKDGTKPTLEISASLIRNSNGQPMNIVTRLRIGLDPIARFEHHEHRIVAEGDTVIVEHTEVWHFHTGEVLRNPFVTVHEVRDGKIALWRDYWDVATMIEQRPEVVDRADHAAEGRGVRRGIGLGRTGARFACGAAVVGAHRSPAALRSRARNPGRADERRARPPELVGSNRPGAEEEDGGDQVDRVDGEAD